MIQNVFASASDLKTLETIINSYTGLTKVKEWCDSNKLYKYIKNKLHDSKLSEIKGQPHRYKIQE